MGILGRELFWRKTKRALYLVLLGILSVIFIGPTLPLDLSLFIIVSILGCLGLNRHAPNLALGYYVRGKIAETLTRMGFGSR